ncbi:MAG: iron donor protein CyaY [Betaproteobacteria bacterium]|nr:iron donor protein CyaY [Betaproteobacteria bacterium]
MTDTEFHQLADAFMTDLEDRLDAADIDWERAPGGVMQIDFDNGTQIIINKQPPLHEIWVAAKSGGFHFRRLGEAWVDTRSGAELLAALNRYCSEQAARVVSLDA